MCIQFPYAAITFNKLEVFFMFLSLGKMWGNVEPTSLTLLDQANLYFSLLKLLTANPVGVVLYPVGSPIGSCRFSENPVGLQGIL